MNKELVKRTEKWMLLERKTYEQRKKADEYYDSELMKLIEEDFIERNRELVRDTVDYLIISVGTSYEPIILSLSLFKPKKVLFLYTEKSKYMLDKVVAYTGIKSSAYEKKIVGEINPVDIYKEIKEFYLSMNRPEKLYIDFTGGTKAMSAAAALAGTMVDVQMVYVASDDYLVDFRKPRPGSEKIVYIENPVVVFGDMEIEKARELFHELNFAGSKEKLSEIKEVIPDPMKRQELNFEYYLASTYEAWDSLDFVIAYTNMEKLVKELNRDGRSFPNHPLVAGGLRVMRQFEMLEKLKDIPNLTIQKKNNAILADKELIFPLMFSMHLNALTRETQSKYDMATLLFYRLLEMIEQRRLATYQLFVQDMDYENFHIDSGFDEMQTMSGKERTEWLRREVFGIKKELFKGKVSDYLPNPVSLMDGFIILSALRDPIVFECHETRLNVLKQMRSKVFLRNNSIFAHGLGPVQKQDYEKFRSFVMNLFERICAIENVSYKEMTDTFSWIMNNREE